MDRVYAQRLAHRRIARRVGLRLVGTGVNVVDRLETVAQAQAGQHAAGIRRIAVGEDQLAAGQRRHRAHQPPILGNRVHLDIVDEIEEFVRIDAVGSHQPRQGRAMLPEIALLNRPRLDRIDAEKPFDERRHPLVDQPEQVRRRRVERVVEIEDPGIDVGKRGRHGSAPSRVGRPGQPVGGRQTVKLSPQPQAPLALGLSKTNPAVKSSSTQFIVDPIRYRIDPAST
jgi:hypothetical protein